MLGVGLDGIPYGNLSRIWVWAFGDPVFIISSSGSSRHLIADGNHYSLVAHCDIDSFSLVSTGPAFPSSEAHTHYVLYKSLPETQMIAHIHNSEIWERTKGRLPDTGDLLYGSKELAKKIMQMAEHNELHRDHGVLRLSGHKGGLFIYGKDESQIRTIIKEMMIY